MSGTDPTGTRPDHGRPTGSAAEGPDMTSPDMTDPDVTSDPTRTAADVQGDDTAPPSGPYVPTVLTGLVVVTVTVLIALARLTDVEVDYGLVLPAGLVVAGALLLLGAAVAVVTGRRRR